MPHLPRRTVLTTVAAVTLTPVVASGLVDTAQAAPAKGEYKFVGTGYPTGATVKVTVTNPAGTTTSYTLGVHPDGTFDTSEVATYRATLTGKHTVATRTTGKRRFAERVEFDLTKTP